MLDHFPLPMPASVGLRSSPCAEQIHSACQKLDQHSTQDSATPVRHSFYNFPQTPQDLNSNHQDTHGLSNKSLALCPILPLSPSSCSVSFSIISYLSEVSGTYCSRSVLAWGNQDRWRTKSHTGPASGSQWEHGGPHVAKLTIPTSLKSGAHGL